MKNEQYLYLLLDSNNMGVLYASPNVFVVNSLKSGFLEGTVRTLFPQIDPSTLKIDPYTVILENELLDRHVTWGWKGKRQRLWDLPKDHITEDFLQKKKLAVLRSSLINKIHLRTTVALNDKSINMPLSYNIDSALQTAVNNSDIDRGIYHRDILELARIRNWSPEMAYKDTKMRLESSNSAKIKIYGLVQKFIDLTNRCESREELDIVENEYDNISMRNQRV